MKIQALKNKDLKKLFDLYCQLIEAEGDFEKMCKAFEETKNNPMYKLFCVYNDEDELIATASLTKCFDLTGDARYYYNMENFVVDENQRGKGVGSFLIKAVEDYVKENNGSYINFTSSFSRKTAHAFYEKMGYVPDCVKGFKKVFQGD